jgi:protein tyrosine/serine phosphatase
VDLEIDDGIEATGSEIRDELASAAAHGIHVVRVPMSAFEPAASDRFDRLVDQGLAVMRDPSARPVYVHCKHGQDRTGLMVGLYRVLQQGWAPEKAYEEMKERGFHPFFLGLKHYFHEKTGWKDARADARSIAAGGL